MNEQKTHYWENNILTCDNFKEMVEKSKKKLEKNVIILPPKEFYELQQIIAEHKEMKQQLQSYKAKEDKLREYIDKEINQPFTSVYDYEQGARDNLCQELYKILNEGDK